MAKLLAHWRGARAEIWEYSCGQGQLLIRFFRDAPNPVHSLYLLCKGCRTVQFNSSWPDMDVRMDWTSSAESPRHILSDGSRLRVDCSAMLAAECESFIHLQDQPR